MNAAHTTNHLNLLLVSITLAVIFVGVKAQATILRNLSGWGVRDVLRRVLTQGLIFLAGNFIGIVVLALFILIKLNK